MKIKKIYELVNMDACRITIVYCGVTIHAEFRNGNFMNRRKASLITTNPFVQDALEKDPRFGKSYKLAATYEIDDKPSKPEIESKPARGSKGGKKAPEQKTENKEKEMQDVESVKTMNDVIDYFVSKGEVIGNPDQIDALKEKYHVNFPNLKL